MNNAKTSDFVLLYYNWGT